MYALQLTANDEIKYNIQTNCGEKSADESVNVSKSMIDITDVFNVYDVQLFLDFSFHLRFFELYEKFSIFLTYEHAEVIAIFGQYREHKLSDDSKFCVR